MGDETLSRTTYIFASVWLAAVVGVLSACGLAESDYQAYEIEQEDGGATTGSTDAGAGEGCEGAASAWSAGLKDTVDGTCANAGCHAGAQGSLDPFVAEDDEANRAALIDWVGDDVTKLTGHIHSDSHGGGNFTDTLPEADISAWHAAELECE